MIGIKRLSANVPRDAHLRIYKSFIILHLDHGDIIYNKPNKKSFKNKIENIQYKACIGITGAIQWTSRQRLYQELGLESLDDRRWYRKFILFHKIMNRASQKQLTIWTPIITQLTTQECQTKKISEGLGQ